MIIAQENINFLSPWRFISVCFLNTKLMLPNSNFFGREIQKMSNWYLVMIQPKFYAIPIIYDLTNWLRDNCKDEYECYGMYYNFKKKEDAAKFILFWG
jgi:hypothetical protein